ncbi:FAD-dependent oxidoreductase [Haloferula sp. A504]|uniref:FAD-dependent oxidoreductase n=1 Tax=Haloferula sp. A504 TaxID=3373601 RepID=UPI0031C39416|nr:FAD-binding oxidoreductase [Verrucomicrobiaceae bacterium E54]
MNTTRTMHSWGRVSPVTTTVDAPAWADQIRPAPGPVLAYGLGRSYGDSCLLSEGRMIETRFLDRILDFNPGTGLLRAEGGISLDAILRFCVPRGWFLPTTPGTRLVTLGGAIANDVHGKNHHRAGCFGNHVPRFELLRSDGTRTLLSEGNPRHAATIGGLGLTGIITWAELQLVPIRSAQLDVELVRFSGLDEFLELSKDSERFWEHTVAWIDCAASGRSLGRGIFIRGNWSAHGGLDPHKPPGASVPVDFPNFALNRFSITAFNTLYYRRFFGRTNSLQQHYSPFFHPLDSVQGWSRIYGKRGFFQYQVVTPTGAGAEPMREMLRIIAESGQGSFLAVIKTFGEKASPGMLSFPSPGITLALDFANQGESTLELFGRLDEVARSCDARFYPAKDARMSREDFVRSYPRLDEFRPHVDPGMSSDFWKRMNA